jgi:hypothetical protein
VSVFGAKSSGFGNYSSSASPFAKAAPNGSEEEKEEKREEKSENTSKQATSFGDILKADTGPERTGEEKIQMAEQDGECRPRVSKGSADVKFSPARRKRRRSIKPERSCMFCRPMAVGEKGESALYDLMCGGQTRSVLVLVSDGHSRQEIFPSWSGAMTLQNET